MTWAKIEVTKVADQQIELAITSRYSNGTEETVTTTLNLFTSQLADCFIIPANLNLGDTFLEEIAGNITIDGIEERTYENIKRIVVTASTNILNLFGTELLDFLLKLHHNILILF